jgi:hypothetical protein
MRLIHWLVIVGYVALDSAVQGAVNPVPLAPPNYSGDDILTLVYDPIGQFWLAHPTDDGGRESNVPKLGTIEIVSAQEFFLEFHWCGLIDVCTGTKAFHLAPPPGFTSLDPLRVEPGLSSEQLSNLLTVDGSLMPSGILTSVDLHVVPEQTGAALAMAAAAVVGPWRRHRRSKPVAREMHPPNSGAHSRVETRRAKPLGNS